MQWLEDWPRGGGGGVGGKIVFYTCGTFSAREFHLSFFRFSPGLWNFYYFMHFVCPNSLSRGGNFGKQGAAKPHVSPLYKCIGVIVTVSSSSVNTN